MQMSLDGFIEGPNGAMDWFPRDNDEQWEDLFNLLRSADTFLLGRAMYPAYSNYWRSVLTNQSAPKNEIKYARIAEKTQHIVFSKTMEKADWENTRIAKDISEEIYNLKQQPGKDIIVWGGATLASALINLGLIDEYRLLVNPVLLGSGKSLFKDLKDGHRLKLIKIKTFKSEVILLNYSSIK